MRDVTTNVFDPIQDHLDQAVFNGTDLRNSVQKFVTKTYFRALDKQLGVLGTEWADLYMTGSLTTYQYSETSDADHSVFPDYDRIWKHLGIDPDACRKALIEMSIERLDGIFLPGTLHPIQYFIVPYGTMPHDVFKPGLRSAWSYFDHMWFVPPERNRVTNVGEEYPQVYARAAAIAEKMAQMLDAGNIDTAKELWENVHKKRQLDQRAGLGDFSEGNITLKWLLHEGLIDRLRNEAGMVIQTKVGAWEGDRWVGSQPELFAILDAMGANHPQLSHPESPEAAQKFIGFMTTGLKMPVEEAQIEYGQYVQHKQEQAIEDKKRREEYEKRRVEFEAEMDRAKLETDKWYKELADQYGAQTDVILHRFDKLKPEQAPPFSGDRELAVQYAAEQGWEWKFIISRGHGAWVWADGETHDYNGLYPHSEAMVDLRNDGDMPDPDPQNMALGWIEKPPLEEGDQPYRVITRGGDGFSDEEILHMLGLSPDEATVDRSGTPMVLQWYGRVSALPHLWDDRVTTKVIYDFDQDRIVLGTQATLPDLPDSKIVGEYVDGNVTLYEADKQWINPTYFRRLWHFSYPHKQLKDLYYKRDEGEYKLKSLPRNRKQDV